MSPAKPGEGIASSNPADGLQAGDAERKLVRAETLERVREISRATNHLLGFGRRITEGEAKIRAAIEAAL